jgi:hypothetical protein
MDDYPDALRTADHLRLAEDYYRAFCDLPPRIPPQSWPRYFMLCHAAELAFKAYLFHRGAARKELKAEAVRHRVSC